MKRTISLKQRIVWSMTSFVALALLLTTSTIFYIYREMENRTIDEWVVSESARLRTRIGRYEGDIKQSFERQISPNIFAWGESDAYPATGMPSYLRELDNGLHQLNINARHVHIMIADFKDGHFYILYDATEHDQRVTRFGFIMLLVSLIMMLCAYFTSLRIATWIISPLQQVTDRLIKWAPGASHFSLDKLDEPSRLIDAFNRVQNQVDASRANEKEFSTNLQHEIRTPLARIRSDSEIMLHLHTQSTTDKDNTAIRLNRIMSSVDEIAASLDSTYEMAFTTPGNIEHINLHDCVNDVLSRMVLETDAAHLTCTNHIEQQQTAFVDATALFTVIRNLVQNAVEHAAPATLVFTSHANGIVLTDNGPGISAEDLPHIFERYYSRRLKDASPVKQSDQTGNPGRQSGLGLAIVNQVCIAHDWTVDVLSPVDNTGRGSAFYIKLT